MADAKDEKAPKKEASDSRLYMGIAFVVVVLVGVVWWSLPPDHLPPVAADDAAAASSGSPSAKTSPAQTEVPARGAAAELVVLTDKPDATIEKLMKRDALAALLDVRHCGASCDALKKVVLDEKQLEIEMMKTEDYILPPKDTLDTVAPGLTTEERARVIEKPNAVIVRTQAPYSTDHLPLRAAFATTVALAEALDGYVYDEISRRIETRRDFAEHLVSVPVGAQPVFKPKQIVIQLYRHSDATARVLTLGMLRYGLPDFVARGANMSAGPQIANVVNAVAAKTVSGKLEVPITITIDDVAKAIGRTPADLGVDPSKSKPVKLTITEAERTEGDPDNDIEELVPEGGSTRDGWDAALTALFGETPKTVRAELDKPLADVAAKARKSLAGAVTRFQKGDGQLFVKSPFSVPADARLDGGPASESLWVQVASCDDRTCAGSISNNPEFALNLAYGKTITVNRGEILDWMLKLRDGTSTGGESIKLLEKK